MGSGVALLVYPYFIGNTWAIFLVGAFLALLPWVPDYVLPFFEGGMEADDPSRQRGLYPGAVQGLTPRVLPVGVDSRFTGTILDFCLNRVQGCEITGP